MKIATLNTFATTILAVALLSGTTADASVRDRVEIRTNNEIASCATAFRDRIDLAEVQRIRHVVTTARPAILGRQFSIETSTWSGDQERRYRATCIVNGDHPPIKFRVTELTD